MFLIPSCTALYLLILTHMWFYCPWCTNTTDWKAGAHHSETSKVKGIALAGERDFQPQRYVEYKSTGKHCTIALRETNLRHGNLSFLKAHLHKEYHILRFLVTISLSALETESG